VWVSRAYGDDRYILGIRPDLLVDLRLDVLREDGPSRCSCTGCRGFQDVRIIDPGWQLGTPMVSAPEIGG